jgi:hypothetical protein
VWLGTIALWIASIKFAWDTWPLNYYVALLCLVPLVFGIVALLVRIVSDRSLSSLSILYSTIILIFTSISVVAVITGGSSSEIRFLTLNGSQIYLTVVLLVVTGSAIYLFLAARKSISLRLLVVSIYVYGAAAFGNAILNGSGLEQTFGGAALWMYLPWQLQGPSLSVVILFTSTVIMLGWHLVRGKINRAAGAVSLTLVLICSALPGWAIFATGDHDNRRLRLTSVERDAFFDQLSDVIEEEVSKLDRSAFDLHAVIDEIGTDTAVIFEWVRQEIEHLPYVGSLRGSVGTLIDRAGNDLDRTLLLQQLLEIAGHSSELVRVEGAPVGVLVESPEMPFVLPPDPKSAVAALEEAGIEAPPVLVREIEDRYRHNQRLYELSQKTVDEILDQLVAPIETNSLVSPETRNSYASDSHWAVRIRAASRPAILDLYSSHDHHNVLETYRSVENLPENLHHKVRFSVTASTTDARDLDLLSVTLRTNRLAGTQAALKILPLDQKGKVALTRMPDFSGGIARAERWVPILESYLGKAIGVGIGADGLTFNAKAYAASSFTGIDAVSDAISIFETLGGAATTPDTSGVPEKFAIRSLSYVVDSIVDGKITRTESRRLFDSQALAGTSPNVELSQDIYFSFPTGAASIEKFFARYSELLTEASNIAAGPKQNIGQLQSNLDLESLLIMRSMLDSGTRPLTIEPNVWSWRIGAKYLDSETIVLESAADIVMNSRFHHPLAGVRSRLRQGVIDTVAETVATMESGIFVKDEGVMLLTKQAMGGLQVIRQSKDVPEKLSQAAVEFIERDLRSNKTVLLPNLMIAAEFQGREGWWALDSNGNVLGMGSDGRGGVLVALTPTTDTVILANVAKSMTSAFCFTTAYLFDKGAASWALCIAGGVSTFGSMGMAAGTAKESLTLLGAVTSLVGGLYGFEDDKARRDIAERWMREHDIEDLDDYRDWATHRGRWEGPDDW